ncbi:DoxX family protein [Rhodococcus triatomae]|uniref:Putative oxidoreductase n=1 Tax=Rhodococcus triatomae TaxID=300028 RepID=A0A1G8ERL6_9NOCA|nr:DoxX family protein [Rhodococcus triatomae]QNG19273.1 DoxX family protein [Rhodococcus triatomae]QNG24814.1 DoxX family protein [Rhodococcus triatomae]SDH72532.1 putative oxidoreductase [Rhodococcus triatomae]
MSDERNERPNSPEPGLSPFDDQPTENLSAGYTDDLTRPLADPGPTADDLAAPTERISTYDQIAPPPVVPPVAAQEPPAAAPVEEPRARRGTLDLGLLVLRVVVGVTLLVHGLQKLTGVWNGPGLGGFEDTLVEAGFDQARLLAILGAVGEVAAGSLLVLGLLTPWAAAAALAIMINAWAFRQAAEPGLAYFAPDGVEYETLLGVCAAVIVLTGPGRIAIDGRRGWATRPRVGSLVVLLLGIAAGVCVWIFLNGTNPLVR